jgi:hypothetical protein
MGQFSFFCPSCGCPTCTCPNKANIGVLYPEFSVDLPTIGTCPPNVLPGTYLPNIQPQGGLICNSIPFNGDCCWYYLINPGAPTGSIAQLYPGSISSPSGCPGAPGAAAGWVLTFSSGAPSPLIKYIYPSPGVLFPGTFSIPAQFLGGGPSWTFYLCDIINSGCPPLGLGNDGFPWGLPLTLQVFANSTGTPCTNCLDCPLLILPATIHVTLTSPNGNCACLVGTYALTWTQATNLWQVTIPGVCGTRAMTLQFGCFVNQSDKAQYTFGVSCPGAFPVAQNRTSFTCSPFSAIFDLGLSTLSCSPCGGAFGVGLHAVVTL